MKDKSCAELCSTLPLMCLVPFKFFLFTRAVLFVYEGRSNFLFTRAVLFVYEGRANEFSVATLAITLAWFPCPSNVNSF